ncbi:MAG: leucyl/phenylalanyl-tRNA--protein transferase, partial [Bacteroidota bacterium]
MPVYELDKDHLIFPHPGLADEDGLLAFGGDLSVDRLLLAYSNGIFPWYSEGQPVMWWSPNPRMLLLPGTMRVSKSLRRTIRQKKFTVSANQAFGEVIRACAKVPRPGQDGTWITQDMILAYEKLHQAGYAHSFESWHEGRL